MVKIATDQDCFIWLGGIVVARINGIRNTIYNLFSIENPHHRSILVINVALSFGHPRNNWTTEVKASLTA